VVEQKKTTTREESVTRNSLTQDPEKKENLVGKKSPDVGSMDGGFWGALGGGGIMITRRRRS